MTAGNNVRFNLWRYTPQTDDNVGGASISGSIVNYAVAGRFQAQEVSQIFVEQGLETSRLFTGHLIPGTIDIRERDELELINPSDHREWHNHFRVVSVSYSDHNPRDPRHYVRVQLTRSVMAHDQQ